MHIIICGGGVVGSNIANHLSLEGNDVVVIDHDNDVTAHLAKTLDIRAIEGNAARPDVLEQAGTQDADMLIAVTGSDEVNMVICQVAHTIFKTPLRIARIRDQHYLEPSWGHLFDEAHVPINAVISPEREVASAIARRLKIPGAFDSIPFEGESLLVIGASANDKSEFFSHPLCDLSKKMKIPFSVLAVLREGAVQQLDQDRHLQQGERFYMAVAPDYVTPLMHKMGHAELEARRILIVGGGNIGYALAEMLEATVDGLDLKIIEYDEERAKHIASHMDSATVIHGNALDPHILNEAQVKTTETIICVTQEDENNILISLLAKYHGCQKAVALVKNPIYHELVSNLGIDSVVHPRSITISSILQHVREGRVFAVHSLGDRLGELIALEVLPAARVIDKTLADLEFPPGVRLGAIMRKEQGILMPEDDIRLQEHDRLLLFAPPRAVKEVGQMFKAHPLL